MNELSNSRRMLQSKSYKNSLDLEEEKVISKNMELSIINNEF